jgi:glycosyltransferase involved in cell wall biosynthesis/SAM-dependent methyltransferase
LEFAVGSAAAFPFESAAFDAVVSFETIEHHDRHQEMIAEVKRVLKADGLLIISSPNKQHYSVETGYRNPFHVKELFREELLTLLRQHFAHISVYGQRVVHGSLIVPDGSGSFESTLQDDNRLEHGSGLLNPLYDLVVAANRELPAQLGSLFEMKVHGMDPAMFYGAHLQDRVNHADQELMQLKIEFAQREVSLIELRTHADALTALRVEHESRLQALGREVEVLRIELNARDGRMDALQQVIAEKEQRLVVARDQAQQQQGLLSELRTHAEALTSLRAEHESRLQALGTAVEVLRAELNSRDERMDALQQLIVEKEQRLVMAHDHAQQQQGLLSELRAEFNSRESRIQTLQNIVDEQSNKLIDQEVAIASAAQASDTQLRQIEAQLADARHVIRHRELTLQDVTSQLELRHAELARILGSNSWKFSAPLRWVRNRIGAIRHGRQPVSYKQVLTTPLASPAYQPWEPEVTAATAGSIAAPTSPHTDGSPIQNAYLSALFEHEQDRRAPEFVASRDVPKPDPESLRAKLIAFYLPQFHPFPENDEWWGRGFTEWTNVTKALPQFLGHTQPQLPSDLGFYDLRLPEILHQQIELARQYGIHGFCFHYYWFAGRRLLEKPLDLFVENRDIDFPFCLCWANENWTRRWDGYDNEVLMAQEHTPANDLAFIRDIADYLRDSRYIRIGGKPLLIVYRPSILPDCAATLDRWRDYCREVGVGEIFLAMAQFDVEDPRAYGFDAALEFPPHKLATGLNAINGALDIVNPDYRGHVVHYQAIVDSAKSWPRPEYPLVRGVFPGWDNEARRPGGGYTFAFSTPERYKEWLDFAVGYAEDNPVAGEKLVMINAWNEWAEGAHLEPDRRYGHAFLQATRDVVEKSSAAAHAAMARPRIVLVSHDAHPHGAQYLTLHIARELDTAFGFDVDLVLLGEGRLTEEFARHATVHDATSMGEDLAALDQLAVKLRAGGATAAIVNTTVSGVFVAPLKRAGMRVVSLIHELPGLISSSRLESHAKAIALHSDKVVFAASQVRDGFAQFATVLDEHALIRPQGLFKRSRYLGKTDLTEGRISLRRKLGIPQDSEIVLTVGYGDRRKGLDLLGDVASRLCPSRPRLHFVWVGHYEESLMDEVRKRVAAAGVLSNFHAVGLEFETDDFYAGADIYALTSREDPFPSVVLEALAVGLPVLAFSGTGGAEPLLTLGCGWLVDELSAAAYADRLVDLLDDEQARMASAHLGREIVARDFGFRRYVFDLLEMTESAPPKVSVIVPNYNYGELLHQRLATIARQSLPPYEIIVLDDCSSDASLQVLEGLRASLPMDIQVIPDKANSGSVFKQWLKGVERATGDFVWIAEADDLSDLDFLSAVVTAMRDDESVVISYCQSSAIGERGETLANDYLAYTNDLSADRWLSAYTATGQEEVDAGLAIKNTVPNVSAVIFRRKELLSTLRQHIDEISSCRIAGDWLTYLLLLEHGRIAYSPRVLNHHRRHSASVTIGSDHLCHLKEVVRAQKFAREHYSIRPEQAERAGDYAQTLYEQFGLANDSAPRLEMDSQLTDLRAISKNEIPQ